MFQLSLTEVQATNLYQLQTICLALARDPQAAVRHFELTQAHADALRQLSADDVWSIVSRVGPHSLFPLRRDWQQLLDCPKPLTAANVVARDAHTGRPLR